MQVRRCAAISLELRETARFELEDLLAGGAGVVARQRWLAHAPHLPAAIELDADEAVLLGSLSPTAWTDATALAERFGSLVDNLLERGLLVVDAEPWAPHRIADEAFRTQYWHPLAAQWHMASRWSGVDGPAEVAAAGVDTSQGLRSRHGPPPAALLSRVPAEARVGLPRIPATGFDDLLDRRSTCRNFDPAAVLSLDALSQMLSRVFGMRGCVHAAADFDVIKRTSPSGGALHPTECYLIVQRVQTLAPGLYHYHLGDHALEPLPTPTGLELSALARSAVAGQHYFADAPVLCVLAPRFARSFWKYRNHPKAYRVAILDVGHMSQTLQLCATEQGWGAFVTAAINEIEIERAFGLCGHAEGPLAVCGFGPRAAAMSTSELDPNGRVWPR